MKLSGIFYAIAALMMGGIVLFVSLTKASLHIWANEGIENRINKIPVDIKITTESGEQIECNYKLPEVNIMPNNLCYGVKTVRDEMWILMTQDKIKKSRIVLLLADKKMSEFNTMIESKHKEKAYESAQEAINKLDEGYQIVNEIDNQNSEEIRIIKEKYMEAGRVYEQILNKKTNSEIKDIISKIDTWNETREKENKK